ncbi:MAG: hypothetical protein IJC48_10070 [Clostridia bacterium]|nr:hypothetical protein [Clostridia bacterium]
MTIINTYSGKQLDVENPSAGSIDINDIAHALSFICRGSGNTNFFFSVARHCVYCAREAWARGMSVRVVLACLLHDASEAYMMDIPKPIKENLLPQYNIYEDQLLACIYEKYLGSPLTEEEARQVDEVDHALLMYDLKYLLNMDIAELPPVHIDLKYEFEPFEESRSAYLSMFKEMTNL